MSGNNVGRVLAALIGGSSVVMAAATVAAMLNSEVAPHEHRDQSLRSKLGIVDKPESDKPETKDVIEPVLLPHDAPKSETYTTRVFVRTTTSSFRVEIDDSKSHPITAIELLRAVVPNSAFTIDERNCEIIIGDFTGVKMTVTLTHGNYNAVTLTQALQEAARLNGFKDFKVALDTTTGKCKLKYGDRSFYVEFNKTGSLAYELGFASDAKYASTDTTCGQEIMSPFRVDVSAPRYVFVLTDELSHPGLHEDGVLCEIPVVSSLQFTDFSQDTMRRRRFGQAIRLQHLNCRLMQPASRRTAADASGTSDARVTTDALIPFDTRGLVVALTLEITRVRPVHPKIHSVSKT